MSKIDDKKELYLDRYKELVENFEGDKDLLETTCGITFIPFVETLYKGFKKLEEMGGCPPCILLDAFGELLQDEFNKVVSASENIK